MTRVLFATAALAAVLSPLPAAARASDMVERMNDPGMQQAMTAAVRAMSEAMLDMPLEPLARAVEAMGDRKTARRMHGSTLRDVAGPRAEDEVREMGRKVPQMMGAMGGMAEAAEEMAPVLKGMVRDMAARMGDAIRDGERGADAHRSGPRREDKDEAPPPSATEE